MLLNDVCSYSVFAKLYVYLYAHLEVLLISFRVTDINLSVSVHILLPVLLLYVPNFVRDSLKHCFIFHQERTISCSYLTMHVLFVVIPQRPKNKRDEN